MHPAAGIAVISLRRLWPALLLLTGAATASAHKPSDSYLTLTVPSSGELLQGQWDIALRDLDFALGLDADHDGTITWGEVKAAGTRIADYAFTRLALEAVGLRPVELAVRYRLLFEVDPTHRGLLQVIDGGAQQAAVLSREASSATLNVTAPGRRQQFAAFLGEGIWHILKGYDHILFLLTLLLPAVVRHGAEGWQPRESLRDTIFDVLQVVTAFTLAHSLTLSLAVLGLVHLPARWVECGIALTVLLGALNNLRPVIVRKRWAMAFAFGLVHGFGFASVLADLGLRGANLALSLVGFNGGVEIGQLLIVVSVLPLAYLARDTLLYRRAFMPLGSTAVVLLATWWLVVRMTGASLG